MSKHVNMQSLSPSLSPSEKKNYILYCNLGNETDIIWGQLYRYYIGSNCPGISGTVPDYKNLSRVPECYVKCPGRVLTYVLCQENRKGSVAIVSTRCCE